MNNKFDYYGNSYVVHFLGEIDANNVNYIYSPQKKNISAEGEQIRNQKWQENLIKDPKSYDGDLVEFIKLENNGNKIDLYFDYTKYSYTIATRSAEYKHLLEKGEYVSNHIAIPTIIKTTDNKMLIGSQLTKVEGVLKWKFTGGFWEKKAETVLDNVNKEIQEEIGDLQISNPKIIGIFSVKNSTTIITTAEVNMTSNQLKQFMEDNKDTVPDSWEMSEIQFVNIDEYTLNSFINNPNIKLGSMGAIAVYSLIEWVKRR